MQYPSNFFSGLSGIVLPVPKYQFPPGHQQSSRLTYYATFFNSLEVNSSFYKIPMKTTVARWASSVPENFRFTFKLFKEITHTRNLDFDSSLVKNFVETISAIGIKKACILVQFPPGLKKENIHEVENLLGQLMIADADNEWKVAVEFRDKSWYTNDVYYMLQTYNCSLVVHDIPKSATPSSVVLSDIVYVRFHGPTGNYGGSYTDDFLLSYATSIKQWLREGKTVYVYFNNTKGDAYANLLRLNSFVV